MENLKECPFCGSRNVEVIEDYYVDGAECIAVICNNCRCSTIPLCRPVDDNGDEYPPDSEEYDEVIDRVIELWNTRRNSYARVDDIIKAAKDMFEECKKYANYGIDITKLEEFHKQLIDLEQQKIREGFDSNDLADI